jgi:hypothetical protein
MRVLRFAGSVLILSAASLLAKDTRDRSSLERAIIIRASEADPVRVESEWMRKLFPQASLSSKGVTCVGGHLYNIWVLDTPKGYTALYFDLGPTEDCKKRMHDEPDAVSNAIDYTKFYSCSPR